ncbi:MAG: universal stress protein [Methanomassiliicoccaceae archaeon]|jgi:nucleotide-binding universal stress UspA family protein|nr:universal stress protein [Euryarchaeota archaeon]HOB38118.1 universal stress protein [Methanomassiliicoccaceae archaeon]HQA21192.1 universal stress protein [Methanomassiliicoccaceae archaeon]HQD87932.1 universal stress protein [Methanomassiliicoccaceae archaeon]
MVGNEGGGLIRGRNLLLATDGKPHSMKAAQYAIELAGLASSRLYMIYVVSGNDEGDKQAAIDMGMKRLDELKSLAAESGVEAITLLEGGNVYESVLSAAERIRAGAIIVGTSGKSTLDRVLMGSVSEHVVRNSRCSVIVIR